MQTLFASVPAASQFTGRLPDIIFALDGSLYEASADVNEPSRRVGYVKVGMVGLNMRKYIDLANLKKRFVDPMAVANLQDNDAVSLALPGAYLKQKNHKTVVEGYRYTIQRYCESDNTRISGKGASLLDTLVELMRLSGRTETEQGHEFVVVQACPYGDCDGTKIRVPVSDQFGKCPTCSRAVIITDVLRVHECFVESGTNQQSYNRLMLALEHLLAAHQIMHYRSSQLEFLQRLAIVMDGPLSINGEPASLHRALMRLIADVNADLAKNGYGPLTILGLTKTGITVDHFNSIADQIPNDIAFAITDEYRGQYITNMDYSKAFGRDEYYGQDVLIKTKAGRQFVIGVPYPCATKGDPMFEKRFDLANYPSLGNVINLITTLESDLYENSMIPVILAHEYASISLAPGGKVLDLATAQAFSAK